MASVTDHPDPTAGDAPGRAAVAPGVAATGPALGGLAVALSAGAAILGLGRFVEDAAAAAEAGYLATLTVLLLGCVAALGLRRRRSGETALLPWTGVLVVTAAWVVPPGPGRGAAVLGLLVASLALAAAGVRLTSAIRAGRGTLAATLRASAVLLPLAVAVQVVFRGSDLLNPALDARTLVVFLAMPLAVALQVAFLAVRRGAVPAAVAAATVVLWTGGLNVAATVAFLALAAGEVLRDPGLSIPQATDAGGGMRRRGLLLRACAVAALAAPFAWQPRTAAVAAAAGLLMTGGVATGAVVAMAAVAALFLAPLQSWFEVAALLGLGLLLLPLVPWLAARRAGQGAGQALTVAAGLALAVAAARCAPALAGTVGGEVAVPALAAPLALLALVATAGALADGRQGGPGLALQRLWSGGLLVVAGLASAYPWLRPEAARSTFEAVGLHPEGVAPVVTAVAATLVGAALAGATPYLARFLARRAARDAPDALRNPPDPASPTPGNPATATGWGLLATALVAVLLLTALATPAAPFGRTLVGHPGILLSAGAPRVETALPAAGGSPGGGAAAEIRRLALVGSLVRAEGVADGATVATVSVFAGDRPLVTWPLRAGEDLGEWAARRPAVAAALRHRPPRPWASWVAPDGDYLGQVYRAQHDARGTENSQADPGGAANPGANAQAEPGSALRLVLERDPNLPPGVQVHVRRLEAWP